jgi:hypothetical protein
VEAVAPLLDGVAHSAALLGWGSDVIGFDTVRSTDHGWGPRLQVFVEPAQVGPVGELVESELPAEFRGWPTYHRSRTGRWPRHRAVNSAKYRLRLPVGR